MATTRPDGTAETEQPEAQGRTIDQFRDRISPRHRHQSLRRDDYHPAPILGLTFETLEALI
jgi:hypothetical protein